MISSKKILFTSLNDHVPWGGSEVLWSQTALYLKDKFEVHVLAKHWYPEPKHIANLSSAGIPIYYKSSVNSIRIKRSLFQKAVNRVFKKNKNFKDHDLEQIPDIGSYDLVVISVGDHTDGKISRYADYLNEKNVKYAIIVQLATDLRIINDSVLIQLKYAYVNAVQVYFLSEENVLKTEMQLGCILKNKAYINNPFYFNQNYLEYKKDDSNFNIACVASLLCFHKGQDLLVTVLGQDKWKQRNLCLNLYGEGINKEQLGRLIAYYGLENKVKLIGHEPNTSNIWKLNMACIMPSRMEGQSLAMLEAMSYGRMVISTKVGDAQRLIKHNETGFLIDAPTVDLIDDALEIAWHNKEKWLEMGKLSRVHLYETIKSDPVEVFANKLLNLLS